MISKSKLEEIRRSLYDDDGYTRINNPHFDLIFEEAFKAGMNHVNNCVSTSIVYQDWLHQDMIRMNYKFCSICGTKLESK